MKLPFLLRKLIIPLGLVELASLSPLLAGPVIEAAENGQVVKTPNYEATVAADGCLTSLRVAGQEFLAADVSISRGAYFHSVESGVLKLPDIEQSGNVITAKSERAAIRYQFAGDSMTWSVENLSDEPLAFYVVIHPAIEAVMDETGEIVTPPCRKAVTGAVCFRDRSRLEIGAGPGEGQTLWGPWEGDTLVWQLTLLPGKQRDITLRMGAASPEERAKISTATRPAMPLGEDLTVLSPQAWQVFQRDSRQGGRIVVSGRVAKDCDAVEARVTGKPLEGKLSGEWKRLPWSPSGRSFLAEWPLEAGGWYDMEFRVLKDGKTVASATVEKFGVGEVFVGAGQSNSTNYGEELTRPVSGMVSTFGGGLWGPADDPQPGAHDKNRGGSFWPAFGDALFERYHVPIGIAVTGQGGSSVRHWLPGGELYNWMMMRIYRLGVGGFRAVLWHQGEADVKMPSEEYAARLAGIIRASTASAGWQFPWFVARVSYQDPGQVSFPAPREAQKKLWDAGIALEGPDTDTLVGDHRDHGGRGIHFSRKGLEAHGKMWADAVSLDPSMATNKQ